MGIVITLDFCSQVAGFQQLPSAFSLSLLSKIFFLNSTQKFNIYPPQNIHTLKLHFVVKLWCCSKAKIYFNALIQHARETLKSKYRRCRPLLCRTQCSLNHSIVADSQLCKRMRNLLGTDLDNIAKDAMGCVNLKIVDCPETVELAHISLHSHLECFYLLCISCKLLVLVTTWLARLDYTVRSCSGLHFQVF